MCQSGEIPWRWCTGLYSKHHEQANSKQEGSAQPALCWTFPAPPMCSKAGLSPQLHSSVGWRQAACLSSIWLYLMTIIPAPIPRFPLLFSQKQQHLFSSQPLPQKQVPASSARTPAVQSPPVLLACASCLPAAPSAKGEGFPDGAWPFLSVLVLFLLWQTIRIHQGGNPRVSENYQDFFHGALHPTACSLWTSSHSQAIRAFVTASTVLLLSSQSVCL